MRQIKITNALTNRRDGTISKYLVDVAAIKNSGGLSAEEEVRLFTLLKNTKDPAEEKKLIEKITKSNLRFVISVAKKYEGIKKHMSLSDIVNIGNQGLIKAVHRFDHTRGFKFISFAVWWIRQTILEEMNQNGDLIRKPSNQVLTNTKITNAEKALEQIMGRAVTQDELLDYLKEKGVVKHAFTASQLNQFNTLFRPSFSMDSYISDDSEQRFVDTMAGDDESQVTMGVNTKDLQNNIAVLVKKLTPVEQTVVEYFFGINGKEELPLDRIAVKIKFSREYTRVLKEKAVRRLRTLAKKTTIKEYIN